MKWGGFVRCRLDVPQLWRAADPEKKSQKPKQTSTNQPEHQKLLKTPLTDSSVPLHLTYKRHLKYVHSFKIV